MSNSSDGPAGPTVRVLVVVASTDRRGAEIEGSELATELGHRRLSAQAIALCPGSGPRHLGVPTLGSSALAPATLHALRRHASDFDVVVAYGSSTLPACAIGLIGSRTPFVYRSIGDPAAWMRGRAQRWRTGAMLRRAAHVIALWPGAVDTLTNAYSVPASKVSVIPNARSLTAFRPANQSERSAARTQLGLSAGVRVVGCIGSLSREKRVERSIDAIAALPDSHLLIVGDGPERVGLEHRARQLLGDRVTFTGALDDVGIAYHAMDQLLITSRTEGMPGVVIEAASCGIPTVATDVGAIDWLRSRGLAVSIVPAEAAPPTIAAAIAGAPVFPTDDIDLSAFGWPEVASQWVTTLRRVVAAPSSSRPTL